jgi:hypothetical protein
MEEWSGGAGEPWSDGVMEHWSDGALEYWSIGVLSASRGWDPERPDDLLGAGGA